MIPCQRHLFELPDDVAYFNCAYTAPLLLAAAATGPSMIKTPPGVLPPATSLKPARRTGPCSVNWWMAARTR